MKPNINLWNWGDQVEFVRLHSTLRALMPGIVTTQKVKLSLFSWKNLIHSTALLPGYVIVVQGEGIVRPDDEESSRSCKTSTSLRMCCWKSPSSIELHWPQYSQLPVSCLKLSRQLIYMTYSTGTRTESVLLRSLRVWQKLISNCKRPQSSVTVDVYPSRFLKFLLLESFYLLKLISLHLQLPVLAWRGPLSLPRQLYVQ